MGRHLTNFDSSTHALWQPALKRAWVDRYGPDCVHSFWRKKLNLPLKVFQVPKILCYRWVYPSNGICSSSTVVSLLFTMSWTATSSCINVLPRHLPRLFWILFSGLWESIDTIQVCKALWCCFCLCVIASNESVFMGVWSTSLSLSIFSVIAVSAYCSGKYFRF